MICKQQQMSACTLVELLVVISILLILSWVGIANVQQAIVRSKVSRVRNDFRIISGALEAYRVDCHVYPPAAIGDVQLDNPLVALTTPVSYLTVLPPDSFGAGWLDLNPSILIRGYIYKDRRTTSHGMPGETYGHIWQTYPESEYLLHSCGPNRIWDVTPYQEYDATNGTVSCGDICILGPM